MMNWECRTKKEDISDCPTPASMALILHSTAVYFLVHCPWPLISVTQTDSIV
jgi:hypothetical protein